MLRQLCLVNGLLLAVCLSVVPAFAQQDRAHQLAAQAASQVAVQCGNVSTRADCHPSHPTGCSHAQHPRYDAYLNFLKNQVPGPVLASTALLNGTDFQSLFGKNIRGEGATFQVTLFRSRSHGMPRAASGRAP